MEKLYEVLNYIQKDNILNIQVFQIDLDLMESQEKL